MHVRSLGPLPKRLPIKVERNSEQAPQQNQAHIQHDRWDIAIFDDSGGDELAETVTSDVLIHSDGDED